MSNRNKFTDDYKKEMVKLITELGKKPADVARDIGVTPTTIRRWVKQYSLHGEDAFPGKGNLRPADAEQRRLEKENKELKEEIAILKKAMGIFSRDVK
ncbi:transposase [Anaerovirgula multivorans]|uniref:Transposase n=1 Tax=Anaerovirgula multivorans TaxID=312168 RepID=A0A239I3C1_9FIRM|nr:transposase [Anaerovirgula multivorans]